MSQLPISDFRLTGRLQCGRLQRGRLQCGRLQSGRLQRASERSQSWDVGLSVWEATVGEATVWKTVDHSELNHAGKSRSVQRESIYAKKLHKNGWR